MIPFLYVSHPANAQAGRQLTWGVSYFGNNIWNPGLHLTLDQPITWKAFGKDGIRSWHAQFELAGYWDPLSHVGTMAGLHFQHRRLYSGRIAFRAGFGGGFYRTFLPETYAVGSDGSIERIRFAGRNYAYTSFMIGTEIHNRARPGRAWFINLRADVAFPYNSYVLPLLFIETGFRFRFKSG